MARRSGLGRGLGALIPTETTHVSASGLREVALARIKPNQFQPCTHFDEEALAALVDSIRAVGVLQPVLVREVGEGEYELIAGERRCRAARRAGLLSIPALVQDADDAEPGTGPRREPAPGGSEPARRGRCLPAADRRLPSHARDRGAAGSARAVPPSRTRCVCCSSPHGAAVHP